MHRFFLSDDALMEFLFQMKQPFRITFLQILHRNAGPFAHDFCHIFLCHGEVLLIRAFPVFLELVHLFRQFFAWSR